MGGMDGVWVREFETRAGHELGKSATFTRVRQLADGEEALPGAVVLQGKQVATDWEEVK